MQTIKTFVENFLQAEVIATEASVKPDLEDYNNKLETMNSFCVSKLHNKFGMIPLTDLESDDFYERWKNNPPVKPRHIYKISHYQDKIYNDVYVVYLSEKNPDEEIFQYSMSLFLATLNDELKIIKSYSFGYDDKKIKEKFEAPMGLSDISFKTLKKPIAIERYQKPEDDDDAMEHYEMDI